MRVQDFAVSFLLTAAHAVPTNPASILSPSANSTLSRSATAAHTFATRDIHFPNKWFHNNCFASFETAAHRDGWQELNCAKQWHVCPEISGLCVKDCSEPATVSVMMKRSGLTAWPCEKVTAGSWRLVSWLHYCGDWQQLTPTEKWRALPVEEQERRLAYGYEGAEKERVDRDDLPSDPEFEAIRQPDYPEWFQ